MILSFLFLRDETMQVSVCRGCQQGGVLSSLLWDFVIVILNNAGYYTQGYAGDIAILIMRKKASIISEFMQEAFKITEG